MSAARNLFLLMASNYSSMNTSDNTMDLLNLHKLKMLQDQYALMRKRTVTANRTMESIGYWLAVAFVVFGVVAVLLNISILIILWINKRKVFRHVFYILLVNFSLMDLLRGLCLIMWALKILSPASNHSPLKPNAKLSIMILKMDQIALTMLRFCNLGTILNLLMITINEFLFIKYPLRYNCWVTRRRAVLLALFSGICCLLFTLFSTFIRAQSNVVGVDLRCRARLRNAANGTDTFNNTDRTTNINCIQRSSPDDELLLGPNQLLNFVLIAFCVLCVGVVIVCYAIFFNIIRQAKKQDESILAEMEHQRKARTEWKLRYIPDFAEYRRPSQVDRRSSDISCISTVEVPITNQKGRASLLSNSTDQRHVKRQLLRRYKYVLVIGFVIICYVLYLGTYSTIQILQFTVLRPGRSKSHKSTLIIRYVLQLLVGLHSVMQPLCYFRNTEFRLYVLKACTSICPCLCHKKIKGDREARYSDVSDCEPVALARKRSANNNTAFGATKNGGGGKTVDLINSNSLLSFNDNDNENTCTRKTSVVQFSTVLVTNEDIDEGRVHFV